MNLKGTLELIITAPKKAITNKYPGNLFITNKETINKIEIIILVLGSSL